MKLFPYQNYLFQKIQKLSWTLIFLVVVTSSIGIINIHSAADGLKTTASFAHLFLGILIMFIIALTPKNVIMRLSAPLYILGIFLLLIVAFYGVSVKNSQRWIDLGLFRFQPSEIMKIAVPLFLAWIIHYLSERSNWIQIPLMIVIIAIPSYLIINQPDLGTAVLIMISGFAVIYLAGLPWKVIISGGLLLIAITPLYWFYFMKDYQKLRILTLFDPYSDPLGKGYHTIQSVIAVGSGGVIGKGYQLGTQTQLKFLPEPHTDFAFAVLAEEWGFMGFMILISLFIVIIYKCTQITLNSFSKFDRLLAGSLTITLFIYMFINIGMVIGILPIVGVPLPFISYGGTTTVVTYATIGLILSCGWRPRPDELIKPLL